MKPLRLALAGPFIGRIELLDELKGLAIVLVVLYHVGGVLGWNNKLHGEVGVDIFVILSGIGLALSSGPVRTLSYLWRRFWRIYPSYWIVLTTFILADWYIRGMTFAPWDIFLHYTGFHAWFGDARAMSINDSFWFITIIVTLYLIYIPLHELLERPDLLLFAGAAISAIAAVAYFEANQPAEFAHLTLRLPGFFVGLLAGRLLKTGKLSVVPSPALGGSFLLIFYVPYIIGFVFTSVWMGCAVMGIYAFLARPLMPSAALSVLKYLGDRSLEIFLIHQPLIREYNVYLLQRYWPGAVQNPYYLIIGICGGLALAIVASDGLHRLVQKLPISSPKKTARETV